MALWVEGRAEPRRSQCLQPVNSPRLVDGPEDTNHQPSSSPTLVIQNINSSQDPVCNTRHSSHCQTRTLHTCRTRLETLHILMFLCQRDHLSPSSTSWYHCLIQEVIVEPGVPEGCTPTCRTPGSGTRVFLADLLLKLRYQSLFFGHYPKLSVSVGTKI